MPPGTERIEDVAFRPASPEEVRAFVVDSFHTMDKDGSGFIERDEAPASGIYLPAAGKGGGAPGTSLVTIAGRAGQAMWIAMADANADGRVSEDEFVTWDLPTFLRRGVPANWRGVAAAAVAAAEHPHARR